MASRTCSRWRSSTPARASTSSRSTTGRPLTPGTTEQPGGFHYATTEREQVEQWWTQWPNAGIGTPDFDAVDVDLYKPECAPTWKRIRPLIPEGTPQNRTARGGLQFIFAAGNARRQRQRSAPASTTLRLAATTSSCRPRHALGRPLRGGRQRPRRRSRSLRPTSAARTRAATSSSSRRRWTRARRSPTERNKAAWWRAVEILRTLPAGTDLEPVRALVQSWVNANCTGNLAEVDVAKQVRGAARTVARERENGTRTGPSRRAPGRVRAAHPLAQAVRGRDALDCLPRQAAPPGDAFHGVVGRKGAGKGTLLAETRVPRHPRRARGEARVVWIGSEDSAEVDIKPRVVAADGDPSRVLVVERGWIQLPGDIPRDRARDGRARRGRDARSSTPSATTSAARTRTRRPTSGTRSAG